MRARARGCVRVCLSMRFFCLVYFLHPTFPCRHNLLGLSDVKRVRRERDKETDRAHNQEAFFWEVLEQGSRRPGLRMTRGPERPVSGSGNVGTSDGADGNFVPPESVAGSSKIDCSTGALSNSVQFLRVSDVFLSRSDNEYAMDLYRAASFDRDDGFSSWIGDPLGDGDETKVMLHQ